MVQGAEAAQAVPVVVEAAETPEEAVAAAPQEAEEEAVLQEAVVAAPVVAGRLVEAVVARLTLPAPTKHHIYAAESYPYPQARLPLH